MHDLEIRKSLEKKFRKLAKRNQKQLEIIANKVDEIRIDPHRYKNLRKPLQHLKRVHIDSHHVLVFSINDERNVVILEDFDHHDKIYR